MVGRRFKRGYLTMMTRRLQSSLSTWKSGLMPRSAASNNSFKPNLLRYTKAMAEKACHGFGSTTQVGRSEEHTSELQSLMRISYAVFCLKKQKQNNKKIT